MIATQTTKQTGQKIMEISKAKKLAREAQMQIDEILNNLSKKTGCHVEVDVDDINTMGEAMPIYITDITLML